MLVCMECGWVCECVCTPPHLNAGVHGGRLRVYARRVVLNLLTHIFLRGGQQPTTYKLERQRLLPINKVWCEAKHSVHVYMEGGQAHHT